MSTFKSDMKTSEDVVDALNKTSGYKSADPDRDQKIIQIKEKRKNTNKNTISASARKDLDRIFMM